MKTLVFQGYSDDTFSEDTTGKDYDCCASGKPITAKVRSAEGKLNVIGHYSPNELGCWSVAIQQAGEDIDIPAWPMRFKTAGSGYSPVLEIDCPDDVTVRFSNQEG